MTHRTALGTVTPHCLADAYNPTVFGRRVLKSIISPACHRKSIAVVPLAAPQREDHGKPQIADSGPETAKMRLVMLVIVVIFGQRKLPTNRCARPPIEAALPPRADWQPCVCRTGVPSGVA